MRKEGIWGRWNGHLAAGACLLLPVALVAAFGPLLAPYSPTAFHMTARLAPPGPGFVLGTDNFGRDVLSRVLTGSRSALAMGLIATALGAALGTAVGVVAGYLGGVADELIMRIVDAVLAIPGLLLALLILTVLGPSLRNAIVAVGLAFAAGLSRVARSATLAARTQDYVRAAEARGERTPYIVLGEILPNIMAPVVVEATIRIGFAVMTGATLSFLGLGVQPPSSDWGLMIAESIPYVSQAPWLVVAPGVAIGITTIGFNVFGDGLRDYLNPQVRS
jgi:peptide/nickel transport system permease protein